MYEPVYFKEVEFTRCTPSCKLSDLDERFLRKLDKARKLAGVPFILNSAYRSKAYEQSMGRKGTSSHCKGLAVDLSCKDSFNREKILESLFKVGFRRIGVYPTFIHVDLDDDKVSAVWLDSSSPFSGG